MSLIAVAMLDDRWTVVMSGACFGERKGCGTEGTLGAHPADQPVRPPATGAMIDFMFAVHGVVLCGDKQSIPLRHPSLDSPVSPVVFTNREVFVFTPMPPACLIGSKQGASTCGNQRQRVAIRRTYEPPGLRLVATCGDV